MANTENAAREPNAYGHQPVLVAESIQWLQPRPGILVDCTVGAGGHAAGFLGADAETRVVGIDRDPAALEIARRKLQRFAGRFELVEGRFDRLPQILGRLGVRKVDGIFADLGVSSMQLESADRGFSFRRSGPLDMRMGPAGPTAADLVNQLEEDDLYQILREYGEERKARRIVRQIADRRRGEPLETTDDLVEAVEAAVGSRRGGDKIHPATRTFQALRIAVNQELDSLETMLDSCLELLKPEGRLVLISYHSLEDRIVKHKLRSWAELEKDQVTGQPLTERRAIEILTRKPVRPTEDEIKANPRSRSAKLRAARKL